MTWRMIYTVIIPKDINVMVAIIDRIDSLGMPQTPCPLVQPLPSPTPKPTIKPAEIIIPKSLETTCLIDWPVKV